MSGGAVAARLIVVLATPVIARLFTPDDYGQAAIFVSIAAVLASISSLGYETAIVVADDDGESRRLVLLSFAVLTGFCLLLQALLITASSFEIQLLWTSNLHHWDMLLPAGIFILGAEKILRSVGVKEKLYSVLAESEFGNATSTVGTRISLGWMYGSTLGGLIIGYLVGGMVSVAVLIARLRRFRRPRQCNSPHIRLSSLAKKHKDFPLYSAPSGLFTALSEYLPILLLGWIYDPMVVGFYALTGRLLRMPTIFIGRALQQVFLSKAAEILRQSRQLFGPLTKTTLGLAAIGLPIFLPIFFYGEPIVNMVLGEKWAESGRYAVLLTPWMFTTFVATPSVAVFIVARKQHLMMALQLLRAVTLFVPFLLAELLQIQALDAIAILSGINTAINLAIIALAYGFCALKGSQ